MASLYPAPMGAGHAGADDERAAAARRFAWVLLGLGLLTRLVWALWVHPPARFVFSDMSGYVSRAQRLAEGLVEPGQRELAWQAYGTHFVLAAPLWLFGKKVGLWVAGALWGVLGGVCVPMTYLLGRRVLPALVDDDRRAERLARVAGWAMLGWVPLWMGSGWFLSEVPFCAFQLAAVWLTVELIGAPRESGKPGESGDEPSVGQGIGVGALWALAFAIRPQTALVVLLTVGTLLVARRAHRVGARAIVAAALPLVLIAGFSSWRFHRHTGRWLGVAENAEMNLTAGRCHNIVTLGEPTPGTAARMEARYGRVRARRVSLPAFRVLDKLPEWHPFALRPALGDTVRVDGYIGEPALHREVRARCYAETGALEQARYTMTNASLLWFFSRQWPVSADRHSPIAFFVASEVFRYVFALAVWLPAWIGAALAFVRIRRAPGPALLAWQLVASVIVAAVFFGTIRLRTPYDPYALILAMAGWAWLVGRVQRRRRRVVAPR